MKDIARNIVFLDIRNTWEYNNRYLANSILIPFNKLPDKLERILSNKNTPIIFFCSTGLRSKVAREFAIERGYKNILGTGTFEEIEKVQQKLFNVRSRVV